MMKKIEWSPFEENKLTVSTSQNFGFVGAGQQIVLDVTAEGIREVCSWYSRDALYDCAWSEDNENHLVSSSGDGSIKLWDTRHAGQPVRSWEEHTAEAHSVDWNVNVRSRKERNGDYTNLRRLFCIQSLRHLLLSFSHFLHFVLLEYPLQPTLFYT